MKWSLPQIDPQCCDPVERECRTKSYTHLTEVCTGRLTSGQRAPSRLFPQKAGWAAAGWLWMAKALGVRVLALQPWEITMSPLTVINQQLPFFLLLLFLITPDDFHSPNPSTTHSCPQHRHTLGEGPSGPTLHPDSDLEP